MPRNSSQPPWWLVALAVAVAGGAVVALLELGIVVFDGPRGLSWLALARVAACATVLFASMIFAWFVGEEPPVGARRLPRLLLVPAGAVGGIAAVLMFQGHPPLETLAAAALAGVVLSVTGVFGFVARHL